MPKIKKKYKLLLISLILVNTSSIAQNNATTNFETNANISSFCQIKANDINFGVVNLPLTVQSANGEMNVLCSNNTPYKVDLNYGTTYVDSTIAGTSGVAGITTSIAYKATTDYETKNPNLKQSGYRLYKDGKPIGPGSPSSLPSNSQFEYNLNGDNNIGDFFCFSYQPNKIAFYTVEAAQLITGTNQINTYVNDTNGLCNSSTGRLNTTNFTKLFGTGASANTGIMKGSFNGDKLAYQITLPNDSTKAWAVGVNSYNATGIGSNQNITMNAKLVPSSSSSNYIAQDTYIDTVTATISY